MNKIYLFGKVIFKSKLKYIIEPKLKLYMEFTIQTISGDKFNCIACEEMCNILRNVATGNYIYIEGFAKFENNSLKIYVSKRYF